MSVSKLVLVDHDFGGITQTDRTDQGVSTIKVINRAFRAAAITFNDEIFYLCVAIEQS